MSFIRCKCGFDIEYWKKGNCSNCKINELQNRLKEAEMVIELIRFHPIIKDEDWCKETIDEYINKYKMTSIK